MFLFASYDSTFLGNVSKNFKIKGGFKMFEAIFQCANCLFLDAYFGSKVEFIWSEKIIVKVKILKKRFHHSVAFSGQALMIYHNLKFSLKQI